MDDHIRSNIDDLAKLSKELAVSDPAYRVFGAGTHRYRSGPILREEDLASFEAEHQVKLPLDYRAFLTTVGDGGAGPYYGLSQLSHTTDGTVPYLPFVWSKAVFVHSPADIGLTAADVEATKFDGSELAMSLPGVLFLAHEGCGYFQFLVVNGPAYGTIWSDWRAADCGLVPTGLTFSAWYKRWAERCLARLAREVLVDQIVVGMRREAVVTLLGDNFSERPQQARGTDLPGTIMSYRDAAVTAFVANGVITRISRGPI